MSSKLELPASNRDCNVLFPRNVGSLAAAQDIVSALRLTLELKSLNVFQRLSLLQHPSIWSEKFLCFKVSSLTLRNQNKTSIKNLHVSVVRLVSCIQDINMHSASQIFVLISTFWCLGFVVYTTDNQIIVKIMTTNPAARFPCGHVTDVDQWDARDRQLIVAVLGWILQYTLRGWHGTAFCPVWLWSVSAHRYSSRVTYSTPPPAIVCCIAYVEQATGQTHCMTSARDLRLFICHGFDDNV